MEKVNVYYLPDNLVKVNLGQHASVNIYGNDLHASEEILDDGLCQISTQNKQLYSILKQYGLRQITQTNAPHLFNLIKGLVVHDNEVIESDNFIKKLSDFEYSVSVKDDIAFQNLAKNQEFIAINTPKTSQQNSDQSGMLGSSQSSDNQRVIE